MTGTCFERYSHGVVWAIHTCTLATSRLNNTCLQQRRRHDESRSLAVHNGQGGRGARMGAHQQLKRCWSCHSIHKTIAQRKVRHRNAATQEIFGHEAEYLLASTPRRVPGAACADHWLGRRVDAEVEVSASTIVETYDLAKNVIDHQISRYPRIPRSLRATSPTTKQGLAPVAKPAAIPTASSLSHISSSMQPAARARKEATQIPIPCVGLRSAPSAMMRIVAR